MSSGENVSELPARSRVSYANGGGNEAERKTPNRLVGKGGVALVMYHLARLGIEFTETSEDSNAGDIWAQTRSGRVVTVEVKTTTGLSWLVRAAQLERTDLYALVLLKSAGVWLMRSEELRHIISTTGQKADHGIYSVPIGLLPKAAEGAWTLFLDGGEWSPVAVVKRGTPEVPKARGARVERRVLADGTVREYQYPARR